MSYAYRGDYDRSLNWLERAYQQRDASLDEIVGEPLFKNLGDDVRFKAFLRKMNLPHHCDAGQHTLIESTRAGSQASPACIKFALHTRAPGEIRSPDPLVVGRMNRG